ncbi:hypothetical protein NQU33_25750, partial [Escherichia coli]|nr:hypothetical protein [Escherichia coli]
PPPTPPPTRQALRRPIFEQIKPFLEKAMTPYNDVLFPGEDINKPISIAAANRFVNRIRGGMDLGYWRTHDFLRSLFSLSAALRGGGG